jgi:hypothetical protein
MDWHNAQSVETLITRLTAEIAEIDTFFYNLADKNRVLAAGMLERKRDDIVRSVVLQLHTSIEDLLTSIILYCVLGITDEALKTRLRSARAKALRKMLYGDRSLGFDMKVNFALALGLVSTAGQKQLADLNTLRNKCSHNWVLKSVVRRGRRPAQKKPPLLSFRGSDLHKVEVLKDFVREYSRVYFRLYAKWVS